MRSRLTSPNVGLGRFAPLPPEPLTPMGKRLRIDFLQVSDITAETHSGYKLIRSVTLSAPGAPAGGRQAAPRAVLAAFVRC